MTASTRTPDDDARLEGKIRSTLYRISDLWDEMLTPPGRRPGSGSGGALEDDHESQVYATPAEAALASAPDVPRNVQVLDVRRQVTLSLNGWCRAVVEDNNVHHDIPRGDDTPAMCAFLVRWVPRIVDDAGAAQAMLDELEMCARAVARCARPSRPEGMVIGECRQIVGPEGEECGTPVRVTTSIADDIEIVCRGCLTSDTMDGWILRMVGTEGPYTVAQLIPVMHRRLGIRATPEQVRQWDARGIIKPLRNGDGTKKTNKQGAVLYPWVATAKSLSDAGIGERRHTAGRAS